MRFLVVVEDYSGQEFARCGYRYIADAVASAKHYRGFATDLIDNETGEVLLAFRDGEIYYSIFE